MTHMARSLVPRSSVLLELRYYQIRVTLKVSSRIPHRVSASVIGQTEDEAAGCGGTSCTQKQCFLLGEKDAEDNGV
ncbi:Protein FAM135B [Tupaia chinensis]|uniref:Protein FAM135B n=1 Tax=Tupaia chinensis TaxID=246437 RepID=L9KKI6_TUPCH|nr:Protein FAM135B [Tupaia chinensis]